MILPRAFLLGKLEPIDSKSCVTQCTSSGSSSREDGHTTSSYRYIWTCHQKFFEVWVQTFSGLDVALRVGLNL